MIPALILYLIRRFKKNLNTSNRHEKLKKLVLKLKAFIFSTAIAVCFSFANSGTNKTLTYHVVKHDEVIGNIKIHKSVVDDATVYSLESHIKAKFLLKFNIIGKEKSIYKNGVLVYSSVFRTLNSKTKVNHEIVWKDGEYRLQSDEGPQSLPIDLITQNLITLYFNEPIGVETVFCDNLKEMVPVHPLGSGKYKVDFSNGKHNVFHYENGQCTKVEAVSPLFNVTLIPARS